MMSSPILANTSQGMPIINSPNHGFASFGLLCKRQIILKWISLNDLATILLKGNKHCAFANLDQLQYLSSRISTASIPRLNNSPPTELTYPRFPLSAMDTFDIPDNLDDAEKALIQTLEVDENSINSIESATREQSNSECWKNERKYRFTASRFQLISKRQRNHDKFAAELIHPKSFSSRHVEHGLKYEPIALREYEKVMLTRKTPVKVLNCGLVISQHMLILAGSLMQGLSILDVSITLDLLRLNVQKLNFMLPLWRLVKIPHSAVKLSMDIVNSKGTMLTFLKFRARWVYLEHPGAILLYTPR